MREPAVFYIKTIYKNRYNKLAVLIGILIITAFIVVGTMLDNMTEREYGRSLVTWRNDYSAERRGFHRILTMTEIREDPISVMMSTESRILNWMIWTYTDIVGTPVFDPMPEKWTNLLELRIRRYQNILNTLERLREDEDIELYDEDVFSLLPYRYMIEFRSEQTLRSRAAILQIMYDEEIKPFYSDYNMSAYQFLYKALLYVFPVLIPVMLIFINSGTPPESKVFLQMQPLSRKRINIIEFITHTSAVYITLLLLLAAGFLAAASINGFGSIQYPVTETARIGNSITWLLLIMPLYTFACSALLYIGKRIKN
jgi:hypothetical protein